MIAIALRGKKVQRQTGQNIFITVQAGEDWDQFVQYCIAHGYWGCENMSLIPGSVGATPVQNVGAFGQEVGDIIETVRCYDPIEDCFVNINNKDCKFGFRRSIFNSEAKGRYIISEVCFRLSIAPKPVLDRVEFHTLRKNDYHEIGFQSKIRDVVLSYRTSGLNLPIGENLGSSGTFFRTGVISGKANFLRVLVTALFRLGPIAAGLILAFGFRYKTSEGFKIPSKRIIGLCGLSGLEVGSFFLLPSNPACVVSRLDKEPSSMQLVQLIEIVSKRVYKKTGIILPIEPEMLGFEEAVALFPIRINS
jgi:UDP-N-acetylmuramate dehydrogenase